MKTILDSQMWSRGGALNIERFPIQWNNFFWWHLCLHSRILHWFDHQRQQVQQWKAWQDAGSSNGVLVQFVKDQSQQVHQEQNRCSADSPPHADLTQAHCPPLWTAHSEESWRVSSQMHHVEWYCKFETIWTRTRLFSRQSVKWCVWNI